jgi:hypothetical protein
MDVKQFQDSRNSKLAEFELGYNSLKREYSSSVLSAIKETDPAEQQSLISRILQINTELSSLVRDMITDINQGSDSFDPTTLDKLTNDLIEYQKQYNEIQTNKDKLQTLKLIYGSSKEKLKETEFMYNLYLIALIVLVFLVIFLVMKTSISTITNSIPTQIAGVRLR